MSQVKLTLRQPPNVEFVHGYPGIPSGGSDRPQAAVKGAVEVRAANPAGVKSKWLRVELRKVETIPGSGGNTFYDYVGPSPVDIWHAKEEWGVVQTCDIPFEIRIPESIPPTLTLEDNVGIRYELIASICTKGKRGFLRKRKSNVVSAQTEIIIDKHDLHSTWPVYCQPDLRQVDLDGVVLTVERHNTCYAPGDQVIVSASVRSEFQTVILRGFEIALRESRTFRAGAYAQGKKTIPQTRVGNLVDNKFAVNVTLMGGMQHQADLNLAIPPNHTTTTLNSARHIDITYVLCVRAIMGTGQPVIMELPVIMSNWPRNVSQEAVRRIGPAPGLSLLAPNAMHSVVPSFGGASRPSNTVSGRPSIPDISRAPTAITVSPASPPTQVNGYTRPDDFGYTGRPTQPSARSIDDHASRRLTITNAQPMEIPANSSIRHRGSANASGSTTVNGYPDEKKLYERAKASVDQVQGSPPASRDGPSSNKHWITAEDDQVKLFNRAQAAVNRTHNPNDGGSPDSSRRAQGGSRQVNGANGSAYVSAVDEKLALRKYQEAKAAVDRTQNADLVSDPPPFEASSSTSAFESAAVEKARLRQELSVRDSTSSSAYESAAAEKARLKRELFERERVMSASKGDEPPPFESSSSSSKPNGNSSSAFESAAAEKARLKREMSEKDRADRERLERTKSNSSSIAYESAAAEKARLKREMEERDRHMPDLPPPFAAGPTRGPSPPNLPGSSSSPPYGGSYAAPALSEKEVLARHFAAQDAAAGGLAPVSPRPTPTPPRAPIMTAAEEKKMLAARYAAERNPSTPPPLMPRPPADYIKETREEDARVSKYVLGDVPLMNGDIPAPPPLPPKPLDD